MMRCHFIVAAVFAAICISLAGIQGHAVEITGTMTSVSPKKEYKTVTFNVSMHCHNCVKKLNENLSFEKGVKSLDVSLDTKTVKITYDPAKTDVSALQKAIEKLGYTAKLVK